MAAAITGFSNKSTLSPNKQIRPGTVMRISSSIVISLIDSGGIISSLVDRDYFKWIRLNLKDIFFINTVWGNSGRISQQVYFSWLAP